jgi:outer membrane protein TolC
MQWERMRVTIIFVFLAGLSFAQEPELLTLDHAIELALQNNRQIKIVSLDNESAREKASVAQTYFFPTLNLTFLGSYLLTPLDFTFEEGLFGTFPSTGPIPEEDITLTTPKRPTFILYGTVRQPLSQLYRINLNVNLAETAVRAAEEQLKTKQNELKSGVKNLYYQIQQTETAEDTAMKTVELYREMERLTADYVLQETALPSDSLEVKSRLAKADYDLMRVHNGLITYKEQLNDLMGRDLNIDFKVSELPELSNVELTLDVVRDTALKNRPDLKEAELKVQQAELDHRSKKAEFIPNVSLSLDYFSPVNIEFVPDHFAGVGIFFDWDIYDWGKKKHELAQKANTIEQARLSAIHLRNQILMEVQSVYRQLQEARQLVISTRLAKQSQEEKLRIAKNRYADETALLKDVLSAEATSSDSARQYQEALATFWSALADLEKAVGGEL